ncbi:uncharacterized protein L969DRAFT_50878 [Mixia osmundae IAM 14324]|uniref:Uncharacterized protein n=1 Tax=Mixia osmundae (strain CBS 9802 / IAM 14324 / JCM 22182 / KY 12970) TaxID=764103 RepID=G7E822_MIXOS|nr:uncharacterized protein L969DRAFT_50878 [Mixia osmundae IAM 14324]KEI38583.1 hypothetical protein L969DRAFT_50878 [Mixia osmundae IAM 14324]GAA98982.1 hypothetical protein E5Q_05671 [Mixia osmundae IAM 14324]
MVRVCSDSQAGQAHPQADRQTAMSYVIAGRKVLNEHLALATFGVTGLGVYLSMRGGPAKDAAGKPKPIITADSSDESNYIKSYVENMEREEAAKKQLKK